jgi:hypothetical protein
MELVCRPVIWKRDQACDHSEKNALKFIVEPLPNGIFAEITRDGERWRYEITIGGAQPVQSDNEQFSSPTDNLYLRLHEFQIGGQMGIRLNRSVALLGEAGVATSRTLSYADGKTKLSSLHVGAEPYASISLRFSFSKQERWEDFGKW